MLAIQPLGAVDARSVARVRAHLAATFAARVIVLPATPLPKAAWYPPRRRWRGERILDDLERRTPAHVAKVLGLTARDVSATKGRIRDWGVLGIAGLSRRAAVVSTHRLGRRGVAAAVVERRLARVAVHEVGHTLGIRHCASRGCVMNDACGSVRTVDRSTGRFCARCRVALGPALRGT